MLDRKEFLEQARRHYEIALAATGVLELELQQMRAGAALFSAVLRLEPNEKEAEEYEQRYDAVRDLLRNERQYGEALREFLGALPSDLTVPGCVKRLEQA